MNWKPRLISKTSIPSITSSTPPPNKRKIGQIYEDQAARFLIARGLKLIARNVHYRVGEIDLVFLEDRKLVFVEVRYRSKEKSWENGLTSLTFGKLGRLKRAIGRYLQLEAEWVREHRIEEIRIDAIAFSGGGIPEWVRGIDL